MQEREEVEGRLESIERVIQDILCATCGEELNQKAPLPKTQHIHSPSKTLDTHFNVSQQQMGEGNQQTPYLKGVQNLDSQSSSSLQQPNFIPTQNLPGPSMTTVNPGALAPQTTAAMSVEWLE